MTDLVIDQEGILSAARQCPSPNCDLRPEQTKLELVVIHGISLPAGQFGTNAIEQLFTNTYPDPELASLRVSAHFLIHRDGQLVQFVCCNKRAWHAGESFWQDRTACNDFSIGIELEGTDDTTYQPDQYTVLIDLLNCLVTKYPTLHAIAGHDQIAPKRKTDPGKFFDWQLVETALAGKLSRDS